MNNAAITVETGSESMNGALWEMPYPGLETALVLAGPKPSPRSAPRTLEELVEQYQDEDPGVFSVGGTFGVDSTAFRLELSDVYVSVVDVTNSLGENEGKVVVVQGMAHFRLAKFFSASAALICEYDPDALGDPLELFDKEMDDDEKAEAVRARNAFATLSGDTVTHYELIGDAKGTNGLYFLFDANGDLSEKQTVFTATGLMDLSWLEKIGVNCGLKIGVIGAYNSFEDSWEVGLGAKFTVPSGKEWMALGRLGFKGGQLNTIAVEVRGDIPIGPVVFTQIKIGVTGIAESVQTFSPGLGVAFGPEINFGSLVSPVAKVLGLKVGSFRVAEVGVAGDVSSDFKDVNLSVEGKLLGLLEIKGGWKRESGNYNEISLSVGTKSSSTFNFQIAGSVGWSSEQLTVKGSLDGSFKWDFTALGITWVGINVGGGISVVYNESSSRRTLSVAVNGRAQVKVAFVKVGVNVGKSWFFDLGSRRAYNCINSELSAVERPSPAGERVPLARGEGGGGGAAGIEGAVIGSYSWTATEFAAGGKMYVTVAAQYSLSDVEWVLYSEDGTSHSSLTPSDVVSVKQVSYSQLELAVDKPAEGAWTLDVYGSQKWNGEVLIYAEAGDPVDTEVRIVSVDRHSVTVEYQAYATGEESLVGLFMERADKADGDYEGTLLDYLEATGDGEFRQATIELPRDVQGGEYRFYLMAQSTNSSEITYSAKTEAVEVVRRTAALCVRDFQVELDASAPASASVLCTVANQGSVAAGDFLVEVVLGDSEINLDRGVVVASTRISLAAGASTELRLAAAIPQEWLGRLGVLSVRLDREKAVDEGLFENDNDAVKTLSFLGPDAAGGKHIEWDAVEGASSYRLEYATEGDWDDAVALSGIAENRVDLALAAGGYEFRVTAFDADGAAIAGASQEWDDDVRFAEEFSLDFDAATKSASTESFALQDGFYDWAGLDLGAFTGSLTLNQVDGVKEGRDAKLLTVNVTNGKVKANAKANDMLLANGLYYFTATRKSMKNQTDAALSFSLAGDLFPNLEAERGVVSLPDSVDAEGRYAETLEGWVGAFAGDDRWEFLVEDAGELRLAVNSPAELSGTIVVELYVQKDNNGQYAKAKSFTVNPKLKSEVLLDDFLVANNFYLQVRAQDNGKGRHNSDYSLALDFEAFDDDPLEDGEWLLSAEDDIRVEGWVGHRNPSDAYLLEVDGGQAGQYRFQLAGDAREATLKITSITGKVLKSAKVDKQGVAVISGLSLYSGEYLVSVDAAKSGKTNKNTDYVLEVTREKSFATVSAEAPAAVEDAARNEKLLFEVEVQEGGSYDVGDLLAAGLKVSFHEAKTNGTLGNLKLKSGQVNLTADDLCYMQVYNSKAAWGDASIGLDAENRKFLYNPLGLGQ